jgi:type IV pilus assembly protein PilB
LLSERDLTKLYATAIKSPFIELGNLKINPKVLGRIPERVARQYQAVLFEAAAAAAAAAATGMKLAMSDPGDLPAVDFLQKLLGKDIQIYIATASDIRHVLDQYKGELESELTKVIPEDKKDKEVEVSAEDVAEDSPVAKTTNLIIDYAIKAGASDIHIEPHEDNVVIRYRIDGVLKEANTLPRRILASLVSRIKIMSNLKIDEHRKPQDGRFKISDPEHTLAVRVSTLPIMDGEKVVMRLLDESSRALTLEELGFNASALARMQRAMVQPHGMILVTGPTGSGKSTTLYSVLSTLNTPQINISTIEDPVEYRIPGVNQTQVNTQAGMTFAGGLRALLRQDPNIIMVGEIRDGETADLAIQAALTGHLVLSTLHTNNAATSLPRLLDMGAEPFLIASTVRVVVGQRLVRRLCPNCRVSYQPNASELAELQKQFQLDTAIKEAQAKSTNPPSNAIAAPVGSKEATASPNQQPAATSAKIPTVWRVGKGCEVCSLSGYKGRLGIYEVLELTEAISKAIVANAVSDEIQRLAISEGMITMQTDGFIKALRGLTTVEEILRVTRE